MRTLVSLFVACLCLLSQICIAQTSVWDGNIPNTNANAPFSGGNGSQASPYIIGSASDLAQLVANTNGIAFYSSGKFFRLNTNISISNINQNYNWVSIGNATNPFAGNFDGNNNQIVLNLQITQINSPYYGLFGQIYEGKVQNLNMNVSLSVHTGSASGYSGGIAGKLVGGTLQNCSVSGSINGISNYTGGLVGHATGSARLQSLISNCRNFANISSSGLFLGGIAGQNNGSIQNSYNAGNINLMPNNTAYLSGGGICGLNESTGIIQSCFNMGLLSAIQNNPIEGGIVGKNKGSISYCYNLGNLMSDANPQSPYIGGLVGWNTGSNASVSYSYNTDFQLINSTKQNSSLVGTNDATSSVTYCYSDGQTDTNTSLISSGTMTNCATLLTRQITGSSLQNIANPYNLGNNAFWVFENNRYPRLANIPEDTCVILSTAAFILADPDNCCRVSAKFPLNTNKGVIWTSSDPTYLSINQDTAVFSSNCIQLETVTLTATLGSRSKSCPIYGIAANTGSIASTGQSLTDRNVPLVLISSLSSSSGGSYQWCVSTNNGQNYTDIPGANQASYMPTQTTNGNYLFRRKVSIPRCNVNDFSVGQWALNLNYSINISQQPQSIAICNNTSTNLSINATTSQGTLSISWQYSTTGTQGPWISLGANGTGSTYNTGTLSTIRYYRCLLSDNITTNYPSSVVTVTVYPVFQINVQPTAQMVCSGNNVTLSASGQGGSGNYTYQWQSSPNNSTFTNINTAAALLPNFIVAPTTNTYYRCNIRDTTCQQTLTGNSALVSVYTSANTGTITSKDTNVCSGYTPSIIASIDGGTGLYLPVYQWQISINGGAFTNIASATSATYTPVAQTNPGVYTYRRMVKDSYCLPNWTPSVNVYTVRVNAPFTATAGIVSNYFGVPISQLNATDAQVQVLSVSSPFTPYTYAWSPGGSTSNTLSNIGVGTYTANVTDAIGCKTTAQVVVQYPTFTPSVIADTSRLYVDYMGKGNRTGQNWDNAIPHTLLQDALNYLGNITKNADTKMGEIWLGVGTRFLIDSNQSSVRINPTQNSPFGTDSASKSFIIPSGVSLFGGFRGNETLKTDRSDRLTSGVVTILDGKLSASKNVYNVLIFGDGSTVLAKPSIVDGVVIANGKAVSTGTNVGQKRGGGAVLVGNSTLRSSLISNCSAVNYGGGVYMQPGSFLVSSFVEKCSAPRGGGVYTAVGSSLTSAKNRVNLFANTLVNNSASIEGAGIYANNYISLSSSVLWNNTVSGISRNQNIKLENNKNSLPRSGYDTIFHSMSYIYANDTFINNYGSNAMILADVNTANGGPMFVDPYNDNGNTNAIGAGTFALRASSPLILTSNSNILSASDLAKFNMDILDAYGNQRLVNAVDVGAFEYQGSPILQPTNNRIYVSQQSKGTGNGSSWSNATNSIQKALSYFAGKTPSGNNRFEIWVSGGTFYPNAVSKFGNSARDLSFTLTEFTDIYGGFTGVAGSENIMDNTTRPKSDLDGNGLIEAWEFTNQTYLSGTAPNVYGQANNSYHVIVRDLNTVSQTQRVIVDGLCIRGGNANGSSDNAKGAAIYALAPLTLNNSSIQQNGGSVNTQGLAVYAPDAQITNSRIANNSLNTANDLSQDGIGALYIESGTITQSLIANNQMAGIMTGGSSNLNITNNTIVSNVLGINIGNNTSLSLTNNALWGNTKTVTNPTPVTSYLQITGSPANASYNAVQEATLSGQGNIMLARNNNAIDGPNFKNISTNPCYLPYCGSALLNIGNNTDAPANDLGGSPRINEGIIDIGAYEFQIDSIMAGEIATDGNTICYNTISGVQIQSSVNATGGSAPLRYQWTFNDSIVPNSNSATFIPVSKSIASGVYKRYVFDSVCNTQGKLSQGTWNLSVLNNFTAVQSGNDTSICYASGLPLQVNVAGASGTYTYQWQTSTNGTTFTNLTGTNNNQSSMLLSGLTANAYIRCKVTDANCGIMYSDTNIITIYGSFNPGIIISGMGNLCQGAANTLISSTSNPSGGVPPYTYSWYVNNMAIPNTNQSTYTPIASEAGIYTYKRMVSDSVCQPTPIVSTNQWVLNLKTRPTGGVSGDTLIKYGQSTSLKISLQGTPPFTYRLSGETSNRTSTTGTEIIVVSPNQNTEYFITSLQDASGCSSLNEDISASAYVSVYFQVSTNKTTVTNGSIAAYRKDGSEIKSTDSLHRLDTVFVKLIPNTSCYLNPIMGLTYNNGSGAKDTTSKVYAGYAEECLYYSFAVTENVNLTANYTTLSPWVIQNSKPFYVPSNDSILIYRPEELAWLAVEAANNNTSFAGICIKLMNSLDLGQGTAANWTPIGDIAAPFQGFVEGNMQTISGLYSHQTNIDFVGLFGYVGNTGILQNLGILSGSVSGGNHNYVGSFAGRCDGTLKNVYNYASIDGGNNSIGGLTGGLGTSGNVFQSYNAGNVNVPNMTSYAGGIAGQSFGNINQCFNIGRINGNQYVGGLVGYARGISGISYSYSTGEVYGNTAVNGLVGFNASTTTQYCYVAAGFNAAAPNMGTSTPLPASCFVDWQMTQTPIEKLSGQAKNTSGMTGNALTSSLGNASTWTFAQGLYPQLSVFANTDASIVSVSPIYISNNECKDSLKTNFIYANGNSVQWQSSVSNPDPLTLSNGTAAVTQNCSGDLADTLTCSKGISSRQICSQVLGFPIFSSGAIQDQTQTICFDIDRPSIEDSISPTGGNTTNYIYTWYENDQAIPNTDTIRYTPTQTNAGSYTYTRKVTELTCYPNGVFSEGIFVLNIISDLQIDSISTDTTLCNNSATQITIEAAGGDSNYTYSWSKSTDGGNNWINIPNADQSLYVTDTLTQSTKFKGSVSSCGITKFAICNVSVLDSFSPGAIVDSTQKLCAQQTANLIRVATPASGGVPPYIYQWIVTPQGLPSNVISQNTATYTPPSLNPKNGDTVFYYTRQARDSRCQASFLNSTDTATIITHLQLNANIVITSNYFGLPLSGVNKSDASVQVFASGGNGQYTYKWQDINGTILGITNAISNLAAGTYTVTVQCPGLPCSIVKNIIIQPITFNPQIITTDSIRLYISYNGAGNRTGSSWANALPNIILQDALDYLGTFAQGGISKRGEVWLGVGLDFSGCYSNTVYFYPTKRSPFVSDDSDPRAKSFQIPNGVNLYGSFYGSETRLNQRTDRASIRTILSGYLSETDRLTTNQANRAYNVLVFGNGTDSLTKTTMVDGISLMYGKANHASNTNLQQGGGAILPTNAIMRNSHTAQNYAVRGGGIYMKSGSWVTGSFHIADSAQIGGAIYAENSYPANTNASRLTDNTKRTNIVANTISQCVASTANKGAGIYLEEYAWIANTVAWDNKIGGSSFDNNVDLKTAYTSSQYTFRYVAWNDNSKGAGITGEVILGNTNSSGPKFNNPLSPITVTIQGFGIPNSGSPLQMTSASLVDSAHSSNLSQYYLDDLDFTGNPRLKGQYIDIGAYEAQVPIIIPSLNRLYVSRLPQGLRDGSSWSNASGDLQFCLDYFAAKTLPNGSAKFEIWVSEGDYCPNKSYILNDTIPTNYSFVLNDKTNVYGGFAGYETSISQRQYADLIYNQNPEKWEFRGQSALSGEVMTGGTSQIAYVRHVVYRPSTSTQTNSNIILDGFNINRANAKNDANSLGGGGLWAGDSISVLNCKFNKSRGDTNAKGIAVYAVNALIKNCVVEENSIAQDVNRINKGASAVYLENGRLESSVINGNYLLGLEIGGNNASKLLNNTISLNNAGIKFSANAPSQLSNNVIWKNYTKNPNVVYNEILGNTNYSATNNAVNGQNFGSNGITLSPNNWDATGPHFAYLNENPGSMYSRNLTPDCSSPLLNTGTNVSLQDTTDLAFHTRIYGSAIDIGAFESQNPILNAGAINTNGETICYSAVPTQQIGSLASATGGKNGSSYIWKANGVIIAGANQASYLPNYALTTTTTFTRWVIDGCYPSGLQSSGAWIVTVKPGISLSYTGSQTLCYNTPTTLGVNASGGDSSNYLYQWYVKDMLTNTWSQLNGETNASLNTPNLTSSRSYYCSVQSCNLTQNSQTFSIFVYPQLSIKKQALPKTICYNGSSSLSIVAQGGIGSYTYQWQQSSTGYLWTNVQGGQSPSLNTGNLSSSTLFRCRVSSCGNDSAFSSPTLVTVRPQAIVASQTSSQSVCLNSQTKLSVTPFGGNNAFIYQWERATMAGNDWANAPGTNNTGQNYTSNNLSNSTYQYRCIVTSSCDGTKDTTQAIILTIYPQLSVTMQPKVTDTFCYNTNVNQLSSGATGGNGSYTYEWVRNTSPTGSVDDWEIVSLSASPTYTPVGKQTTTYYYKCNINSCASTITSNVAQVFIRPKFNSGSIATGPNSTICFGESPSPIGNLISPSGGQGAAQGFWTLNGVQIMNGSIPVTGLSYTPTVSAPGTYTYKRYAKDSGCEKDSTVSSNVFVLTINQNPVANPITSQILCINDNSTPVQFSTSNTVGTNTYTWTNDKSGYGLARSGSASIPQFQANNLTNSPATLSIAVTPTLTNQGKSCVGSPTNFTYTILPIPSISSLRDTTVCAGLGVSIPFMSSDTGGINTFNWTSSLGSNSPNYIGINANGTGSLNFTSANNQNTGQTTTITITPIFTANGKTCTGTSMEQKTMKITVNPIPKLTSATTIASICSGKPINYTATSNVSGATFAWNRPAIPSINANVGKTGTANITNDILTNSSNTASQSVSYIYTLTANSCVTPTPYTVNTSVYPAFTTGSIGTFAQTVCNNTSAGTQPTTAPALGGNGTISYQWQVKKDGGAATVVATTPDYTIPNQSVAGVYVYTRWAKDATCNTTLTQSTGQYTITVLSPLAGSLSVTSNFNGLAIEEPGANNGNAQITVNGGLSPYTYAWTPGGESINTISNKAPGTYSVHITDNNGCAFDSSIVIKDIIFSPQVINDTSRFYVTYLGKGLRNGSSWANALPRQILQYALDSAGKIALANNKYGEVWLGVGTDYVSTNNGMATFVPSSKRKYSPFVSDTSDARAKSFVIPSGVSLYGNFVGNETNKVRSSRKTYLTILSGNLQNDTNNLRAAYNVVVFGNGINDLAKPAYINGMHITGGNANHPNNTSLQQGGGIVMVGNSVIQDAIIFGNYANSGGGVFMQKNSYLNSSLLYANNAQNGGGIYTQAASDFANAPVIAYNTIANNTMNSSGAGVFLNDYVTFMGNTVWNNKNGTGVSQDMNIGLQSPYTTNLHRFAYIFANDVAANTYGIGSTTLSNTNLDTANNGPLFRDPLKDNGTVSPFKNGAFELTTLSPMIATTAPGEIYFSPSALRLDTANDVYGNRRIIGDAIDCGAVELGIDVTPKPTRNRLYVSKQKKGAGDGSSWSNAMNNVSEALDYFSKRTAVPGVRFEIWISGGIHYPQVNIPGTTDIRHLSFILNENTDIYGGFRGTPGDEDSNNAITRPQSDLDMNGAIDGWEYTNVTTLSGNADLNLPNNGRYHVLYRNSGSLPSILDGLRIMGGNANGHSGVDSFGGGLYSLQSIQMKNCVFSLNSASSTGKGAAIYAVNPFMDGCFISDNFIDNDPTDTNVLTSAIVINGGSIQNSVIQENNTTAIITIGTGTSNFTNNTIVNNTAGILDLNEAHTNITNCIAWNNAQTKNGNSIRIPFVIANGSVTISHCAVDTLFSDYGSTTILLDTANNGLNGPRFQVVNSPYYINNYRSACLSPLQNAGDNVSWTIADKDFAGVSRKVETVDIGAYERQNLSLDSGAIANTGETICYNTKPKQSISSLRGYANGNGTLTYLWQLSTDNGANWVNAPTPNNGASYTPNQALTQTTQYRRLVLDACYTQGKISQGIWTVTVNPELQINLQTPPHAICYDSSAYLSVETQGGNGTYASTWQYRINNSPNWADFHASNSLHFTTPIQQNSFATRVKVNSCGQDTIYSDSVFITVKPKFIQDNPSDTTICYANATDLMLPPAMGGSGILSYLWEQSADSTNWEVAEGINNETDYTTSVLTQSMYYRRQAYGSTCGGNITSKVAKVTVLPKLIQNRGSDTAICYNTDVFLSLGAASGGSGNISYQWEASTDSMLWTNAFYSLGNTNPDYQTVALQDSMYFRRKINSTCTNDLSYSDTLFVKVWKDFMQDTLVGQDICEHSSTTLISSEAHGGSGNVTYIWQQSTDSISNWMDAEGVNTNPSYTTPIMHQNMYYRRMATASECGGTIYTNIVKIRVFDTLVPGEILDGSEGICFGSAPLTISSTINASAEGGVQYQWYYSFNQGDTLPILGANYASYTTIPLTQVGDFSYIRIATSNCNLSKTSTGVRNVHVFPDLLSNTYVTSNYNGYNISDVGAQDGSARVDVSGGQSPYTYLWSSGETTDSIYNKGAGLYWVLITDNAACSNLDTIRLNAPQFHIDTIDQCGRIYVTQAGSGINSGNSWENAIPSELLQVAMNYLKSWASTGDQYGEIWIGLGEGAQDSGIAHFYPSNLSPFDTSNGNDPRAKSFVIPSGIRVYGGFYGNEEDINERNNRNEIHTVLSGNLGNIADSLDDAYNVVVFGDGLNPLSKLSILDNVSITAGRANHPNDPLLRSGAGVILVANARLQASEISNCTALDSAGGAFVRSGGLIDNCLIHDNTAAIGGGIATEAIASVPTIPSRIYYNTIVNNTASQAEGGAGVYQGKYAEVIGNIIWNNTYMGASENNNHVFAESQGGNIAYDPVFTPFQYNALNDSKYGVLEASSNTFILGNANLDANGPNFLDPLMNNGTINPLFYNSFSLDIKSPLIMETHAFFNDTLELLALGISTVDINGNPRINDYMDIGAYEYAEEKILKPENNRRLYVSINKKGNGDGSSWNNAASNIQKALNYFNVLDTLEGDDRYEIWVSKGYFYPTESNVENTTDIRNNSFVLNGKTNLFGGFAGYETELDQRSRIDADSNGIIESWEFTNRSILTGEFSPHFGQTDNAYHVLYRDSTDGNERIVLDGFFITKGAAGINSPTKEGSALYTTEPMTLQNCMVYRNTYDSGANTSTIYGKDLYFVQSAARENGSINSQLRDNDTNGVIHIEGGLIKNSYVYLNSSAAIHVEGEGNTQIINTTLVNNTLGLRLTNANHTLLANNAVWGNYKIVEGDTSYQQIYSEASLPRASYNAIQGEDLAGMGNIRLRDDNDSLSMSIFVNTDSLRTNLSPGCNSPLINRGDTNGVYLAGDLDVLLATRIVEKIDIGAFETEYLLLQGGTIASTGQTICYNAIPTETIGSTIDASGGLDSIVYEWYYNDTLIEGATQANYLPTQQLIKESIYTRLAKNQCGTRASSEGSWRIWILPQLHIANQSSHRDICNGTSVTHFVSPPAGEGVYTYQWFMSKDRENFNLISSATDSMYETPNLNEDTYYYCALSNCDSTVYSDTIYVKIQTSLNAGAIVNFTGAICLNSEAPMITEVRPASGEFGKYEYFWKANGIVIPNSNSTTWQTDGSKHNESITYTRWVTDSICHNTPIASEGAFTIQINRLPASHLSEDASARHADSSILDIQFRGRPPFYYRLTSDSEATERVHPSATTLHLPVGHISTTIYRMVYLRDDNGCIAPPDSLTGRSQIVSHTFIDDSICSGETYVFGDRLLDESGVYYDTLTNIYRDDSVIHLSLIVIEDEVIEMDTDFSLCGHDERINIPIRILSGYPKKYSLYFDTIAQDAGFINRENIPLNEEEVYIHLPQNLRPNEYHLRVKFSNDHNCPSPEHAITIRRNFPHEDIVKQKNSFMFYLKNSSYNGGYELKEYQWSMDGIEIPQATKSYFYTAGGLDLNAIYSVKVKLMDNTELEICPFKAVPITKDVNVNPTNLRPEQELTIRLISFPDIPQHSFIKLYDMQGKLLNTKVITSNVNTMNAPASPGAYIVRVLIPNENDYVFKIIVN